MQNKQISRIGMSLLYIAAGINHFVNPAFYLKIMPSYFPFPLELVYLSGVCEVVFGAMVIFQKTRRLACWLIIAMLIAFLPVHIQMLIDNYDKGGMLLWISIIRLPLQFVLIYWAFKVSKH